jgi:hypothetical protein
VDLRWEVSSEREDRPAIYLRYSPDGGRSWHPVSAEPEGPRSRVDLDRLPGGDDCRLQVIASTVLETAVAETPPFRVRRKPRVAMIAGGSAPRTHRGPLLELIGTAYSPDGFAAEEDLVWNSDLQGRLGQGSHLLTPGLVAGAHRITLSAPDGLGGETRAETVIRVLPEEP